MYLDDNKNTSLLNDVSCVSVTAIGAVCCASVSAIGAVSCNSMTAPAVSLNSQSIYSVMSFFNITGNGSNAVQIL